MLFMMMLFTATLSAPKFCVDSCEGEELSVSAGLGDLPLRDDEDLVGVLDRAQPVRYRDGGPALLGLVECLLHHLKIKTKWLQ